MEVPMGAVERVAARHLKRRAKRSGDLEWGIAEVDKALDILQDVADVWGLRGHGLSYVGNESVEDVYREAAEIVKAIRGPVSRSLAKPLEALKRVGRTAGQAFTIHYRRGGAVDYEKRTHQFSAEMSDLQMFRVPTKIYLVGTPLGNIEFFRPQPDRVGGEVVSWTYEERDGAILTLFND